MKDKSKIHLGPTHSAAAKTAAFIICILMLCITAISFFVIYGMFASGSYWMTEEALREELFEQISDTDSYSLLYRYEKGQKYAIDDLLKYKNIGYVKIECGDESIDTYEKYFAPVDERHTYTFYWTVEVNSATGQFCYVSLPDGYSPEQYPPEKLATVSIGVASDLTLPDEYYWSDILINLIYLFQYWNNNFS